MGRGAAGGSALWRANPRPGGWRAPSGLSIVLGACAPGAAPGAFTARPFGTLRRAAIVLRSRRLATVCSSPMQTARGRDCSRARALVATCAGRGRRCQYPMAWLPPSSLTDMRSFSIPLRRGTRVVTCCGATTCNCLPGALSAWFNSARFGAATRKGSGVFFGPRPSKWYTRWPKKTPDPLAIRCYPDLNQARFQAWFQLG